MEAEVSLSSLQNTYSGC